MGKKTVFSRDLCKNFHIVEIAMSVRTRSYERHKLWVI